MGYPVQKDDAVTPLLIYCPDPEDPLKGKDGLTLTATLSKNGGAFGSATGTVAGLGGGIYKLPPSATNVNTFGPLVLRVTDGDEIDRVELFHVVAYNPIVVTSDSALVDLIVAGVGDVTASVDPEDVRDAIGLATANLDTQLSGINNKTTNLPSDPADASVVAGLIGGLDTKLNTIDDFLDTEIAAIKAKTDALPADTAAALTAIDDFLDTEITAIKAVTDKLGQEVGSDGVPTADYFENAPTSGGGGGATLEQIQDELDDRNLTAANIDRKVSNAGQVEYPTGKVLDGTSASVFTSNTLSVQVPAGAFIGQSILMLGGSLAGQRRLITGHTKSGSGPSATHTFTVGGTYLGQTHQPFTAAPAVNQDYLVAG